MIYLLYFIHVLVCVFLILVVLLQQGKGADLSVFGGGSTLAAFGARGATTLLHKLTVGSFIVFTLTTLTIAIMKGSASSSVMGEEPAATAPAPAEAPATTPATPPPAAETPPPAAETAPAPPPQAEAQPPAAEAAPQPAPPPPAANDDGGG